MKSKDLRIDTYKWSTEMMRIGNKAVQKAREENKQMGQPNVFFRNGIIYYELPDGTITTQSPFEDTANK